MPSVGTVKKAKITKHNPAKSLKDRHGVGIALLQALENNDPEAFIEILDAYLKVNRTRIAKKTHLARSTVQLAFSKKGNPTIRTVARIVHEAVA